MKVKLRNITYNVITELTYEHASRLLAIAKGKTFELADDRYKFDAEKLEIIKQPKKKKKTENPEGDK